MAKKTDKPSGVDAFDASYGSLWGERWPALRQALAAPPRRVVRLNRFATTPLDTVGPVEPVHELPACFTADTLPAPIGRPASHYLMDGASVVVARALDVHPGMRVLDLCAAPGGKTLILAEAVENTGVLVANEPSQARRRRLAGVLSDYLPQEVRQRIKVTGHDGTRWALHEPEAYDRVLVDAPCSSEAHVLRDSKELATFSPARSRQLQQRQRALIAAAIDASRPGGEIVYATCSVHPGENDGAIEWLKKKRKGRFAVLATEAPFGEATEHGWAILPDRSAFGPSYFARLRRL